jgi:hypothetical protein
MNSVTIFQNQTQHTGEEIKPHGLAVEHRSTAMEAVQKYGAQPILIRRIIRDRILEDFEGEERNKRIKRVPELKQIQNFTKFLRSKGEGEIKTVMDLEKW